MQFSHDDKSDDDDDEDEIVVTGHSVTPEEEAEMKAELQREDTRERGEESEPEEIQKEDLPSQPPPIDAKPREGELGEINSIFFFHFEKEQDNKVSVCVGD